MRRPVVRLTLLMVAVLGVPASISALPSDMSAPDADTPGGADKLFAASPSDSPGAPAAVGRTPPSGNPLWAIPLGTLSSTRERPIFSPSRRPPPSAVASVPAAKALPPPEPARDERLQLSLVGTIIGGDQSFGIFIDQPTKAALRLKIGEDYQGWRLRSVQGREVTLERGQQTTIVSLPLPGASGAGPVRARTDSAVAEIPADPPARPGNRH
ncbi:hypothetical protein [Bradyrhizobium genosp. P]|uniref:hypothetical protein n=1 Tax=Bradyrhizobium genosp. P TaxID=83641 RepID=UPI003CEBBEE4